MFIYKLKLPLLILLVLLNSCSKSSNLGVETIPVDYSTSKFFNKVKIKSISFQPLTRYDTVSSNDLSQANQILIEELTKLHYFNPNDNKIVSDQVFSSSLPSLIQSAQNFAVTNGVDATLTGIITESKISSDRVNVRFELYLVSSNPEITEPLWVAIFDNESKSLTSNLINSNYKSASKNSMSFKSTQEIIHGGLLGAIDSLEEALATRVQMKRK